MFASIGDIYFHITLKSIKDYDLIAREYGNEFYIDMGGYSTKLKPQSVAKVRKLFNKVLSDLRTPSKFMQDIEDLGLGFEFDVSQQAVCLYYEKGLDVYPLVIKDIDNIKEDNITIEIDKNFEGDNIRKYTINKFTGLAYFVNNLDLYV